MKILSNNASASQSARLQLGHAIGFNARAMLCCALWILCLPAASLAAGTNLITIVNQGAGAAWTAAIWKTNNGSGVGIGTAVAPSNGNTYLCLSNGVAFGTTGNPTRIRNPVVTGVVQTFPGDSLYLGTNTDIRFKNTAGQTCNFPGTNGNPGLILDGGLLNPGDNAIYTITGSILVSNLSWLCLGNGAAADIDTGRGFTIPAFLQGSDNTALVLFQATNANQTATTISGTTNTYSGQWIIKAGRLLGVGTGALGTNSITVDPNYVLASYFGTVVDEAGPAQFEAGADLNSAGALTLVHGGQMRLHQVCVFNAVNIEGTPLGAGIYFYPDLLANFPNNFRTGGSGAIVVRPYNPIPPSLGPTIVTQPLPEMVYAGSTARFSVNASVNGAPPLTFHWQKASNNVFNNLADGGNIAGSTNASLIVSNVSAIDATNYMVIVGNAGGTVASSVVALTIVSPSGEAYESAVRADNPVAFYQLNETGDPQVAPFITPAFDFAGGYVGTYGSAVQNGNGAYNIHGPRPSPDGFPGFDSGNLAARFTNPGAGDLISVMPWNLNTNTVTITAWVNPVGAQVTSAGIVFCRSGTSGAQGGFDYSGSGAVNALGDHTLGYNWNDEPDTYNWNSGLTTPEGQWSLVALVVTPTNATVYVINTNGAVASVHTYNHRVVAFSANTLIGDDSLDGGNGNRAFNGTIDDVAVFNTSLSLSQLLTLYTNAAGAVNFPPQIGVQPVSTNLYQGQTAQFAAIAAGTPTFSYQWQAGTVGSGIYTNVNEGGNVSGSTSATLTISSVDFPNAADYVMVVANAYGSVTSSPVTLTISATGPPLTISLGIQQATGADWDTANNWSDGTGNNQNGVGASQSAAANPGSTYELLPGSRMRSPVNPIIAIFPGNILTNDGNAVWVNNPGAGNTTIAEIRLKQPPNNTNFISTVMFPRLVMNGGQFDVGNDGTAIVDGEIDILTNAPFYNDSANDRGYIITALLTGGGGSSIEYHGYNATLFNPTYTGNLNIAGTSNTFSGRWNVVLGLLLGTGTNSLGTNTISVGANGALQTTYDIHNSAGDLLITGGGKLFLNQNDTFHSVVVAGSSLPPGTYSAATLTGLYPTNFPASWIPYNGAGNITNASGSITVLVQSGPQITQQPVSLSLYPSQTASFQIAAIGNPPISYQWRAGATNSGVYTNLIEGEKISGSATTNLMITNVGPGNEADYVCIITNSFGRATSSVASLLILPTGAAEAITLGVSQATGTDWNTTNQWSDNNPASLSALEFPGSTYEILAQARMRTPANASFTNFPGNILTVDGDGVFANNGSATIGEIRFKHANPGTVYFPRLVMNGGQLDSGDNGTIAIAGQMDILANTPIYVDSAAGVERSYQIDALLTGSAGIEWHDFDALLQSGGGLLITGTSNTFSGTWNVVQGVLIGGGANSLGTNSITVGVNGALETTYDLNNPAANLVLNGQMFLHQNDTFRTVTLSNSLALGPGTYSYVYLTNNYPASFPAFWNPQIGSGISTISGSITVLALPTVALNFSLTGSDLTLTWSQGLLYQATDLNGPWTPVSGAASPYTFTVDSTLPEVFFRVRVE